MIHLSVCTLFAYGLLLTNKGTITSGFHRKNEQQSIFTNFIEHNHKRKELKNVVRTFSSWKPFASWPSTA